MKAKCPHCKNKWSVSRKYSGATVQCPTCRKPVGLAPSAPIFALILTVLISSGLSVAVSFWLMSTKTDIGRSGAETAEMQTKMTALTAKLDNFNTEFARFQTELDRAAARPAMAQPNVARSNTFSMVDVVPDAMKRLSSEPADQNDLPQPQKSDSTLDAVDSLLVFEGTVTRSMGGQIVLAKSKRKTNQFTYSNFKYVPPFILDEVSALKFGSGNSIPQNAAGLVITMFVVKDGTYKYKENIGAIEIPKEVNQYRQTNLIDVPEQKLVEFQAEQPLPTSRRGAPQPGRRSAPGRRSPQGKRPPQRPRPR
jgi:hypothetical protein